MEEPKSPDKKQEDKKNFDEESRKHSEEKRKKLDDLIKMMDTIYKITEEIKEEGKPFFESLKGKIKDLSAQEKVSIVSSVIPLLLMAATDNTVEGIGFLDTTKFLLQKRMVM